MRAAWFVWLCSLSLPLLAQCPSMPGSGGGSGSSGSSGGSGGGGPSGPGAPAPGQSGPRDLVGPATSGRPADAPRATGPWTGGPAKPASPSVAAPAAAAPRTTGGAPAPSATAPARPAAPRGTPITLTRGTTSKEALQVAWDYPVHVPTGNDATRFVGALTRAAAFAEVAGDDPRPLLVLRECRACAGTDLALLRGDQCNDKTIVLARWFHCVKLPPDVLRPDHPYRNLFPAEHAPHLFVCLADGSRAAELDGHQSQNDVWNALTAELRAFADDDVEAKAKEALSLLDQLDRADGDVEIADRELNRELERSGARSPRAKSLQERLGAATKTRDAARERLHALHALTPRQTAPAPVAAR